MAPAAPAEVAPPAARKGKRKAAEPEEQADEKAPSIASPPKRARISKSKLDEGEPSPAPAAAEGPLC